MIIHGPWAFDLAAAARILDGCARDPVVLPMARWAGAYGLGCAKAAGAYPDAPWLVRSAQDPGSGPAGAMTADLSRPLIVVTLPP